MIATLPRRRCISWALSAVLDTYDLPDAPPYTQLLTLGCPDDFLAVRVGLPNVGAAPYRVSRILACASAGFGDYVNPTGGGAWRRLTFAYRGADVASMATADDAPEQAIVAPALRDPGTGETTNPSWTWSDWTPLTSVRRADGAEGAEGARVLMLRMTLPQRQTITYANGNYTAFVNRASAHHGFDYATGKLAGDVGEQPADAAAAHLGQNIATIGCVQFLTRHAGVVGMITGDSHHAGTATTTQLGNALLKATLSMAGPLSGRLPLGYVTCATGGSVSARFFPRLMALLPVVRPSFVVLPGWTFNDGAAGEQAGAAACDIFFARLLLAAEVCTAQGAMPVFLTPFPRDAAAMTAERVGPWLRLRNAILALRQSGALVVDATPVLGRVTEGVLDGTYAEGMSDDTVHPNDAGHEAVAQQLMWHLNPAAA